MLPLITTPKYPRRGRPHVDPALRVRNWGWYYLVKGKSKLSDDRLDERYVTVQGIERPRLFFQIRSTGSSPTEPSRYHDRRSIYALVHEGGAFPSAKSWFESPLWSLLTDSSKLSRTYVARFIEREVQARGWFRPTSRESWIGNWIFNGKEPAFGFKSEPVYDNMVDHLAALPELEGVSLISALYREAYSEFRLDEAKKLSVGLISALQSGAFSIAIPGWLKGRLEAVVCDRVLYNIWVTESDMPHQHGTSKRSRRERSRDFWSWYLPSTNPHREYGSSGQLISFDTARTRWFRRNIDQLHTGWDEARLLDRTDFDDLVNGYRPSKNSDDGELQRLVDAQRDRAFFDASRDARIRREVLGKVEALPPRTRVSSLPRSKS